jgi:hypothetical protein
LRACADKEGKVGRTRDANEAWRRYYERADRARARFGDPLERHIRRLRLRNTVVDVCLAVAFIGVAAAIAAFVLSSVGDL